MKESTKETFKSSIRNTGQGLSKIAKGSLDLGGVFAKQLVKELFNVDHNKKDKNNKRNTKKQIDYEKQINKKLEIEIILLKEILKETKMANYIAKQKILMERRKEPHTIENNLESEFKEEEEKEKKPKDKDNKPEENKDEEESSLLSSIFGFFKDIIKGIFGKIVDSVMSLLGPAVTKALGTIFDGVSLLGKGVFRGVQGLIGGIRGLFSGGTAGILSSYRPFSSNTSNSENSFLNTSKKYNSKTESTGMLLGSSSALFDSDISGETTNTSNDADSNSSFVNASYRRPLNTNSNFNNLRTNVSEPVRNTNDNTSVITNTSSNTNNLENTSTLVNTSSEYEIRRENTEATKELTKVLKNKEKDNTQKRLEKQLENNSNKKENSDEDIKSFADDIKDAFSKAMLENIDSLSLIANALGMHSRGSSGTGGNSIGAGRTGESTGASTLAGPPLLSPENGSKALNSFINSSPIGALATGALQGVSTMLEKDYGVPVDTGSGLSLNDDQKKTAGIIYKKFIDAGFSDVQARAAIANAYQESRFNPKAAGDGGNSIGLFQANMKGGEGRGHTKENLMDPEYNTDVIINAAKRSSNFTNATSLEDAVKYFTKEVEIPADKDGTEVATRLAWAKKLENLDFSGNGSSTESSKSLSGILLDVASEVKDAVTNMSSQSSTVNAPSKGGDTVNSGNSSTTVINSGGESSQDSSARKYLDRSQGYWGFTG